MFESIDHLRFRFARETCLWIVLSCAILAFGFFAGLRELSYEGERTVNANINGQIYMYYFSQELLKNEIRQAREAATPQENRS